MICQDATLHQLCRVPLLERVLPCSLWQVLPPIYKESEARIGGQNYSSYPTVRMEEKSAGNSVL